MVLAACLLGAAAGVRDARAGNPLVLFDPSTQTAYAYPGTVNVYTDLGTNGILTNAESDTLVAHAVASWTNVPTSRFAGIIAGPILVDGVPTDITLANVDSIVTYTGPERYNGGGIHVIYDTDGSITSGYFGAPPGVAGISSPEFGEDLVPELLESWVVLNGSVIDPTDTSPPGASFAGVYTHEFGHAINLAHTQSNGGIVFFGDNDGPGGCGSLGGIPDVTITETMYPYLDVTPGSTGEYQATVDLLDDTATLSDIYPAPGWPSGTGTISGTIFQPDSVTQVTGVNVIARNLADPLGDCVSAMSGNYTQGALGPDGRYTLTGLTPGQQYVVYVDAIIDGGFPTTPTATVFPEEYWNGPNETGDIDTDPACDYVAITAAAGVTTIADIYLNSAAGALPLGDHDAVNVALPFGFPFCGTVYHSVWIASNGYVTFGVGDAASAPGVTSLLVGPPRIAGLWADLDPTAGGAIVALEENGNFEIKYISVPEFDFGFGGGMATFTITLRPDGTHQVQYGAVAAYWGALAGRSPGAGASDPGPTDLSAASQPLGVYPVDTIYETWDLLSDLPDLSGATLEYSICGMPVAVDPPEHLLRPVLFQSRPNPFRSSTAIAFELPQAGPVRLRVFDLRGRLVKTLLDEVQTAGDHSVQWNGQDQDGHGVAPGVYFYRLDAPGFTTTRKTLRVE